MPEADGGDEAVAAAGEVVAHDGGGADAHRAHGPQACGRAVLAKQQRHQRRHAACKRIDRLSGDPKPFRDSMSIPISITTGINEPS